MSERTPISHPTMHDYITRLMAGELIRLEVMIDCDGHLEEPWILTFDQSEGFRLTASVVKSNETDILAVPGQVSWNTIFLADNIDQKLKL